MCHKFARLTLVLAQNQQYVSNYIHTVVKESQVNLVTEG